MTRQTNVAKQVRLSINTSQNLSDLCELRPHESHLRTRNRLSMRKTWATGAALLVWPVGDQNKIQARLGKDSGCFLL